MPKIVWIAVGMGVILAFAVTLAGAVAGIAWLAAAVGVGAGGYLAGRMAKAAGLLQGAIVAAVWIVIESLAPDAGQAPNVLADTATTILRDLIYLGLGAAGGWLATRS